MRASRQGEDLLDAHVHTARYGREEGPRVLLIHAIGFDHRSWEPILPYLEDRYHLVAVDLPGHGASDKPATADYGVRAMGRRIVRLLDELGWERAILVGNSIGGGTSLSAAVQAPERVTALALLNSVAFRSGLPQLGKLSFLPVLPLVGSYAPALAVRVGLELVRCGWGSVTAERSSLCCEYLRSVEGRGAFYRALRLLYGPDLTTNEKLYSTLRCPAFVLHGARDPLIRLSHAERLARTLPNAELEVIPRCGHFPQEEQPHLVGPRVRQFLDRVTADRPTRSARSVAATASP
jgi:pimeloyl-ACP methyl ester carboxylesterase